MQVEESVAKKWQPPPRPEWVQRIVDEGHCMDIRGIVPLDEASLLATAMNNTGLSGFGGDEWREPFRVLIRALEDEGKLNLLGRLRARSDLLQLLEARLQIEEAYRLHPEIDDEEIQQPLIVVGQGRSGTSFLINVLASNPENGALLLWECMFPCPPPEQATYRTDPRIEKAHRLIDQWYRVTPEIASIHEFGASLPQEDVHILALSFMAPSWLGLLGEVPSYMLHMAQTDVMPALWYHKRVLKLLQWKNPRRRWVLKNVTFLDQMELVLQVYPDACFVWPHRDPVRAVASMRNFLGCVQWGRSDFPLDGQFMEFVVDPVQAARRLDGTVDKIESGTIPAERIHHLQYGDLIRDPLGEIEIIYDYFDLPLGAEGKAAISSYLTENPRDARLAHRFSMGNDADIARMRKEFQRYQEYFQVPIE